VAATGTSNCPRLVSVVIPTRDRAGLVGRAIHSVLRQTWSDLEVLVVDDGSTDATAEVVARFADPRIQFIPCWPAKGAGAARNEGLRRARGHWVAFLDSDDEWLPEKLAWQVAQLDAARPAATVAYCQAEVDDALTTRRFVVRLPPHEGDILDRLLAGWCPLTTSAFLVERTALLGVGGFDPTFPCGEDYDLWLRLALHANRFVVVDRPLVIKHEGEHPRITGDPAARLRGFELLDRRWGSVIEGRLGPRVRARWRWRALARVDHARLLRVREAVRGGDRRAGWTYCRAMVPGLPWSGRYLARGLACGLLGWHTYAGLARVRVGLGRVIARARGRRRPRSRPPDRRDGRSRPRGAAPGGGGSVRPVTLPARWIEALTVVAETARQVKIRYAIVGGLGIALSKGFDFEPIRPPRGSARVGQPKDLDVFLLGPDETRQRFRALLQSAWSQPSPKIDVVPIYHDQIRFSGQEVTLRYRSVVVPVEPRVFATFEVEVAHLRIPLLHPRTHVHMMGHNFARLRKIRGNIQRLGRQPQEDVQCPVLPEAVFRVFHRFKREKLRRYPVRYALVLFRMHLYDRELDGGRGLLLTAKRWFRQQCPRMAAVIRRGLE
jgi:glycosyltransferase involved in cell wall biosynthesis